MCTVCMYVSHPRVILYYNTIQRKIDTMVAVIVEKRVDIRKATTTRQLARSSDSAAARQRGRPVKAGPHPLLSTADTAIDSPCPAAYLCYTSYRNIRRCREKNKASQEGFPDRGQGYSWAMAHLIGFFVQGTVPSPRLHDHLVPLPVTHDHHRVQPS
jgi:hypothetical protein